MKLELAKIVDFNPEQHKILTDLIYFTAEYDGIMPLSERFFTLSAKTTGLVHILGKIADKLVAYLGFDINSGDTEFFVHPKYRNSGMGNNLLAMVLTELKEKIYCWSHGNHPAAEILAKKHGLIKVRNLLQLKKENNFIVSTFEFNYPLIRLDKFEEKYLSDVVDLNHKAFYWHREQSNWNAENFKNLQHDSKITGFWVAIRKDIDKVVGFICTKISFPEFKTPNKSEKIGEIYLIAVDPDFQNQGIANLLLRRGIEFLHYQQVTYIELYVEDYNYKAINLYKNWGFKIFNTHVAYASKRAECILNK